MISITIPTYNNLKYLKCTINSIKKNSVLNNYEILLHINDGHDGTLDYAKSNNFKFTSSQKNIGLCSSLNKVSKLAKYNYLLYSHDDMYFCPNWDKYLYDEIFRIGHNNFYLSSSTIGTTGNFLNCGDSFDNFDEQKFLDNYNSVKFDNLQGSTWAPHVVHKTLWFKVGGFSEEFFPGAGSDPDFNLKLWNIGVRIFKSLSKSKIYHFKSKTLRRKVSSVGSKSGKLFIKKWGFSIKFFKKHYLESGKFYTNELSGPNKNLIYFFDFLLCKINYFYLKLFNKS